MTRTKAADADPRRAPLPLPEKYRELCSLPAKPLRSLRRRANRLLPRLHPEWRESAAPLCRTGRDNGLRSRPWKGIRVPSISSLRNHGGAPARRRNRRLLSAALCAGFLLATDPAAALTRACSKGQ